MELLPICFADKTSIGAVLRSADDGFVGLKPDSKLQDDGAIAMLGSRRS